MTTYFDMGRGNSRTTAVPLVFPEWLAARDFITWHQDVRGEDILSLLPEVAERRFGPSGPLPERIEEEFDAAEAIARELSAYTLFPPDCIQLNALIPRLTEIAVTGESPDHPLTAIDIMHRREERNAEEQQQNDLETAALMANVLGRGSSVPDAIPLPFSFADPLYADMDISGTRIQDIGAYPEQERQWLAD